MAIHYIPYTIPVTKQKNAKKYSYKETPITDFPAEFAKIQ
jgi:hypothetical protein